MLKLFKTVFGLVFWMISNILDTLDNFSNIQTGSEIEQTDKIISPEYNKIKEDFFTKNLISDKLPMIFGSEDGFTNGMQIGIKETYVNAYTQGIQQREIEKLQKELKIKQQRQRKNIKKQRMEEKQRKEKEKNEMESIIAMQKYDEEIRKRNEDSDCWWKI